MALKKPSQAAKTAASSEDADRLADQLANKPYGETLSKKAQEAIDRAAKSKEIPKAKSVSISLPPEIIEQLEDEVRDNKRSGDGPKTVSGILREILEKSGYTGATIRNK